MQQLSHGQSKYAFNEFVSFSGKQNENEQLYCETDIHLEKEDNRDGGSK